MQCCQIYIFQNFQCKSNTDGAPADYIPQLASFGPQHWGAAICTIDGQRYSIGDANVPFTMQSACQAITYAICLNELGADRVHSFQGKEPSGRAGDDIVLDHQSMQLITYVSRKKEEKKRCGFNFTEFLRNEKIPTYFLQIDHTTH